MRVLDRSAVSAPARAPLKRIRTLSTSIPLLPSEPLSAGEQARVADLLYAAKPVSWRGRGDLPQFPWKATQRLPSLLVIDLWSGIGGLCVALLSLGVHFYALAAENSEECIQSVQSCMPQVVHVKKVENVTASLLVKLAGRRKMDGILLGGGSPCQGNTSLNNKAGGLKDTRSLQPSHLARLRNEIRAEAALAGLHVYVFLENAGSSPIDVIQQ